MGRKFQLCGASVIVYQGNKVLLQQRRDNQCWGYHGGGVEMGENVEAAAKRELLEETGLTANSRSTDTELNETGVAQAKALANVLADADLSLARVYSSRQKRALMTAQIAAQRLDLPVVPLDGLEEICFGL